MYRTLPISDRCFAIPLPTLERPEEEPAPDPLVDVPFLVKSKLHALRNGAVDWNSELELLGAMFDHKFERFVESILRGMPDGSATLAVRSWAERVRASQAAAAACGDSVTPIAA